MLSTPIVVVSLDKIPLKELEFCTLAIETGHAIVTTNSNLAHLLLFMVLLHYWLSEQIFLLVRLNHAKTFKVKVLEVSLEELHERLVQTIPN